jgi:hypothetical protein
MTTTTTTTTGFADAVRRALDDLPPATVTELVEGLDEHLAEVGVPDLVSLLALLGPPERYAADLRASAGLPPRAASTPAPPLPPPVPPPAAHHAAPKFDIRARHLARTALALIAVITLVSLALAKDFVDPRTIAVITVAVGAGAWVLRGLARVADIPARFADGTLVALVALTLAVAATAGAAHPRDHVVTTFPFGTVTTIGYASLIMPDLTGIPMPVAMETAREMGLEPTVIGRSDPTSVVVSQDPPPGSFVSPGTEVRLTTDAPVGPAATFPTIATPPTQSPSTTG